MGAFVPITLAGKSHVLRELPRRANREYQSLVTGTVRKALDVSDSLDTVDDVIEALAASGETMLDLLIAYDAAGAVWPGHTPVLPDREWINERATDRECYEAIKKVLNIAFPPGADLLRLIPELRPWLIQAISRGVSAAAIALTLSPSTSSAPPSTAGDPTTSKPGSPTRSSSSSSKGRARAARSRAKSSSTG